MTSLSKEDLGLMINEIKDLKQQTRILRDIINERQALIDRLEDEIEDDKRNKRLNPNVQK